MSRLLILHASQSGNVIETSERISREAHQRHLSVEMKSMDEYDWIKLPEEKLVIFVCSVIGQGEEPDKMKKFWKFLLRKDLELDSLSMIKFAVFGQGDSSYIKFNYPAKKLHKRLEQLGGISLIPRGDGDDQHYLGIDGALDPWLIILWNVVLDMYPIPKGLHIIPSTIMPLNTFNVVKIVSSEYVNYVNQTVLVDGLENQDGLKIQDSSINDNKDTFEADKFDPSIYNKDVLGSTLMTVISNKRLTPSTHFQDVRHIEFECDVTYGAGDVVVVYPQNRPEKVQQVLDLFGWSSIADTPHLFTVNPAVPDVTLPKWLELPITPRRLLERHVDVFGRPRRYLFHMLAFFARDPIHVEKLREFASAQGQDEVYAYAHKMKRTTFEVVQDFTSVVVPLKYLLDIVTHMRPRSFSIASCRKVTKNIECTVAVVTYRTKMKEDRVGVCTDWMNGLKIGGTVYVDLDVVMCDVVKGTLEIPKRAETPIVCIATGTGIAPMRAIMLEHCLRSDTQHCLIFGNRNEEADFFYRDEWERYHVNVVTAFSRDQEEKVYVQHRILEHGEYLWGLVEKGAYVYLSGNAKRMPVDVADALVRIFEKFGGLDKPDALKYLKQMEKSKRFQQECWS